MAPKLLETHPAAPGTTRGRATVLGGHADTVRIIYANGKSIVIRSLKNPLESDTYIDHQYATTVAKFSPNGSWVASGDVSGKVRVWGVNKDLKCEVAAVSGSVDDIEWSDDGQRIVAGGDGRGKIVKAFIWDSGSDLGDFSGISKRVNSVAFRPKRPYRIVTASEDFGVNTYEGPPFKIKHASKAHSNFANCVRFSPDGERFVSVGSDSKIFLYSGDTGEKTGELTGGHSGTVYQASWSPDGAKLLTVGADKTAKVWDVATGKVATSFAIGTAVEHMQVGCLWLGKHLVSLSLNGDLNLLDESAGKARGVLQGHSVNITAMAAVPKEGVVVTGSYDGQIFQWRGGIGCTGRAAPATAHKAAVVALSASGAEVVTAGTDDSAHWAALPLPECGSPAVHKLPGAPLGLSASANGTALCLTNKGAVLMKKSGVVSTTPISGNPTAVALSPDGATAAVGFGDFSVKLFRVSGDSLAEDCTLEAKHRGSITALAFSPDGSLLASADQNREVVVWDAVARATKMTRMVYHSARVLSLAWSPSGRVLASGSLDSSVILWSMDKEPTKRVTVPQAHREGVCALAFLDDNTLVTAGLDACVRRWQLDLE